MARKTKATSAEMNFETSNAHAAKAVKAADSGSCLTALKNLTDAGWYAGLAHSRMRRGKASGKSSDFRVQFKESDTMRDIHDAAKHVAKTCVGSDKLSGLGSRRRRSRR